MLALSLNIGGGVCIVKPAEIQCHVHTKCNSRPDMVLYPETLCILDFDLAVLCKQCRLSSDTTQHGILAGSALFTYRNFNGKYCKNENIHQKTLDVP